MGRDTRLGAQEPRCADHQQDERNDPEKEAVFRVDEKHFPDFITKPRPQARHCSWTVPRRRGARQPASASPTGAGLLAGGWLVAAAFSRLRAQRRPRLRRPARNSSLALGYCRRLFPIARAAPASASPVGAELLASGWLLQAPSADYQPCSVLRRAGSLASAASRVFCPRSSWPVFR
jgi:hypothetical protein